MPAFKTNEEYVLHLLGQLKSKDDEIDRLTAERDKWRRSDEHKNEYIRSLGSDTEQGWSEAQYLNALLEQSSKHISKLTVELNRLTALAQNGQSAIDTNKRLVEEVERLRVERNAVVADLATGWLCGACKIHERTKRPWAYCEKLKYSNDTCANFEWRGIEKGAEYESIL